MRVPILVAAAAAVAAAVWAAPPSGGVEPDGRGLVTVEGELRPLAGLFGDAPKALAAGEPGGLWADDKFVVLLADGRVLARLQAALPRADAAVRVRGIPHDDGRAVTPVRVEYKRVGAWVPFDLPRSGTLAPAVLGGDE